MRSPLFAERPSEPQSALLEAGPWNETAPEEIRFPSEPEEELADPWDTDPAWESPEELVALELPEEEDREETDSSLTAGNVAATIASMVLHLWLIATLAGMTVEEEAPPTVPPIQTRMVEQQQPEEPEEVVEYELANPKQEQRDVRPVINARSVGLVKTEDPRIESEPQPITRINPEEQRHRMYDIPQGRQISQELVVKGTFGEALVQLESALDRITWEIAQNLQESKVLVVWMLDASGSLTKQREKIASRLKRVYGELDALKQAEQIPRQDRGLLSGVVTYGAQTRFLTRHPTDAFPVIRDAVQNAPVDESGVENVFTAVSQVMDLWAKYRASQGRRIMLILVTDETGDDFGAHEMAISRCRHYGAKAYVVGPSAVFGRRKGYVPYVAPENGKTYQLPVDLGPETPMYQHVHLPFWFSGPQYKRLSSGFGPYALSRLVQETGGIYFTTNMTTMKGLAAVGSYDREQLKPFEPDYRFGTRQEYLQHLQGHPLRLAVLRAAELSRQYEAEGTPRMRLKVNPDNFRQVASEAQKKVARSTAMIDAILQAFPRNLEDEYEREPSLRWRMAYNLARGRLLAQKIRNYEYNFACAHMKSALTPEEVGSKANRWIFKPASQLNYATQGKRLARTARSLLQRILDEAPGTPWAVLASRELKHPFGLRVIKQYVPPPKPKKNPSAGPQEPKPRLLLAREKKKQQKKKPKKPQPKPVLPKL